MNSIALSEKDIARFWKYVNIKGPDDCWEWQGGNNGAGHGQFYIKTVSGKAVREYAHRISWMLKFGDIPEGMLVCHKCDNPPCCNPKHFFVGTPRDNMQDASKKGRCKPSYFRGEQFSRTKLKEKDVLEIKRLLREGKVSESQIARNYHVTIQAIYLIKTGRNWAWLN